MRIIDAKWEKRNLGVDCRECHVDVSDTREAIEDAIRQVEDSQYLVARIPSVRIDAVQCFQEHHYQFIEAAIKLDCDLKKAQLPPRFQSIGQMVSWEKMSDKDLDILYSEIDQNIFKTDRIILDPFFTKKQAADRYKFWTMDLVREGHRPYQVIYNQKVVGFFLNKEIQPGVFDGLLAGTYHEYEGSGMGICVQYAGLEMAKQMGGKRYIGHVSGNNPAVLKTLEMIGFHIKLMEYILIKHN